MLSLRRLPQSLLLLLLTANQSTAFPFPRDALHDLLGTLMPRDCGNPCGYDNQYCCGSNQVCFTSGVIAGCSNTAAGGGFGVYTTTWTQTQTFTSTFSSYWPAATTPAPAACIPVPGSGQIACGSICCANWQYCARDGQCMASGPEPNPAPSPPPVWTTYTTGGTTITTQYNPPYRPTTTGTGAEPTATGNGTVPAAPAGGSTSPNLSPGAIAGIVIGVLAGIALLGLICFCCVVRGLWHGLLAILGLGKKKERRSETVIHEEEYHSTAHGRRQKHGGWFGGGGRPHSVSPSRKSEKKSSGAGLLGLGALAGTLMLLLGLRRDKKRKAQSRARSEPGSSYWSGSYTTDSRSRDSRGTRVTRDTRRSHRTERTRHSRTASRR